MATRPRGIPAPVIAEVAATLSRFYTHSQIDNLFMRLGVVADERPSGVNKLDKVTSYLRWADEDMGLDSHAVLGGALQEFMDTPLPDHLRDLVRERRSAGRERIRQALATHGLSYQPGGIILGGKLSAPTRSLEELIRSRNLPALEIEFNRALDNVEADPPAAITAACAILESTFRVIIADERLQLPSDQAVQPLWRVVQAHLNLSPAKTNDPYLRQMLSGLTSVVHGIAGLRSNAGSAHGRGPAGSTVEARYARLAVHAAHTLVVFVLENWKP